MKKILLFASLMLTLSSCDSKSYHVKSGTAITIDGDTIEFYGGTITYPFSVNVVLEIWLLKRKEIDMEIKNVGQLRKIIDNLSDDYEIEMRVRRKLSDEELKGCRYPYPYDTEYLTLEFDDIGVSDKVLCLGVTSKNY